MAREFVIQIDNQPGELAHLMRAVAVRGINVEHLSCVGAGPTACALVIPDDSRAMREVLGGLGYRYIEGDALIVDVPDRPGGLADITERLGSAGVNILGTLCVGERPGVMEMAITVDDEVKAKAALARDLVGAHR